MDTTTAALVIATETMVTGTASGKCEVRAALAPLQAARCFAGIAGDLD
jgi:hypothetical protein